MRRRNSAGPGLLARYQSFKSIVLTADIPRVHFFHCHRGQFPLLLGLLSDLSYKYIPSLKTQCFLSSREGLLPCPHRRLIKQIKMISKLMLDLTTGGFPNKSLRCGKFL